MVKTTPFQYLSDSSFSNINCCFKIRDTKVQTRCNEIQAAQSDIGVLMLYQILISIKTRHTISYEVALTELQKNAFFCKAHEKPVLVNISYVTFHCMSHRPPNKSPAAGSLQVPILYHT